MPASPRGATSRSGGERSRFARGGAAFHQSAASRPKRLLRQPGGFEGGAVVALLAPYSRSPAASRASSGVAYSLPLVIKVAAAVRLGGAGQIASATALRPCSTPCGASNRHS